MASKKLKRAGKVAAAIGAAYLASQALGKKKPSSTSAEAKGLKITRAKKFGESDEGQMSRLDAAQQRGLEITRSKPFAVSDEATPATYQNVPASKFLSTPGGFGRATPEQVDAQMEAFGPMAKKGKFISKKGKKAKDMSEEHEGMESEAEERKEYAMEEKGYRETSSGKMKKMVGGQMVKKAKLGMFGKVSKSVAVNKYTGDIITEEDIRSSMAPYVVAQNKKGDRLTKADIKNAEYALKKGLPKPDITSTEGSFVRGGSVIARGNRLFKVKPTKLF